MCQKQTLGAFVNLRPNLNQSVVGQDIIFSVFRLKSKPTVGVPISKLISKQTKDPE